MLSKYAERLIEAHEIVRTVGFVVRAAGDDGQVRDLHTRIEIARLSSTRYRPMIWTLSPQMACWVRHEAKGDTPNLMRDSADAALSAAIDYVASKAMPVTSQDRAQSARIEERPEMLAPRTVINRDTPLSELRYVVFCPIHGVPQTGPTDLSVNALTEVARLSRAVCSLCNGQHFPSLVLGRRPARRLKINLAINGAPAAATIDRAEGDSVGNFHLYGSTNQLIEIVPAAVCSFTVEESWTD